MGNWQLEVFKLGLYVSFPVCIFYYFNQPEYFEEWVVKKKREIYPPEDKAAKEQFLSTMKAIREKQDSRYVSSLDKKVA